VNVLCTILAVARAEPGLTRGGWTVMLISIGLVMWLCAFCIRRIMRESRPHEHHHAPLEIDTHDLPGSRPS